MAIILNCILTNFTKHEQKVLQADREIYSVFADKRHDFTAIKCILHVVLQSRRNKHV